MMRLRSSKGSSTPQPHTDLSQASPAKEGTKEKKITHRGIPPKKRMLPGRKPSSSKAIPHNEYADLIKIEPSTSDNLDCSLP